MKFGIFDHMDRAGSSIAAQYGERLSLIEAYERAGFYGYYLAEHHCTPLGLAPSPTVFLSAASQRTSRIRLGALVFALSMYNPLRIYEEICMLDNLSNGRLDVGIGRGISPIELGFYGLDVSDAQEKFEEVTAIIHAAMTSLELTFKGKHFQFANVPLEIVPVQDARSKLGAKLPIWYGAVTPETAERCADRGYNVMFNAPAGLVRKATDRFRSRWTAAGKESAHLLSAG